MRDSVVGSRTAPKFLSLEPYIKMIMKEIQCPSEKRRWSICNNPRAAILNL